MFLHDAFRHTGNIGVRGRFVHLYLNGLYWGLYEAIERPDHSFAAEHLGGDKEDYDLIKGTLWDVSRNGSLKEGSKTAWNTMFNNWFDASGGTNISGRVSTISDTDLAQIEQYLDVDQFIDYMITLWTYNRQDFPRKNWYAFGKRNPVGGAPLIPFTFHTWDSEAAVGQGVDEASRWPDSRETADRWNNMANTSNDTGPVRIYRRLISNASFRQRWGDRAQELMLNDGPLNPANSVARYAARAAEIDLAVIAESARWGDSSFEWNDREGDPQGAPYFMSRDAEWLAERDRILEQYLPVRTGFAIELMQEYDLFPTIDAPVFSQHGGEYDPGFQLAMINPNAAGMIWYTLDGTDPRTSPSKTFYMTPITLPGAVYVRACVQVVTSYSAVNVAGFMPTGGPTLAVSEIMYHPAAPPAASQYLTEDFEYIEILNTGDDSVDMQAITVVDGVQFDFADSLIPVMAPGQYVVLVKNLAAFGERYGLDVTPAGVFIGSLNNDGETLALAAAGMEFRSIAYNDADNWPGRPDGRGASLERIDFVVDPSDDDAWASSSEYNGNPGVAGAGQTIDILVNEVLTHTDLDPTDSIELYNASDAAVDIGGWYLSDTWNEYKKFRIPSPMVLTPGEYVVFDEYDFNASGVGGAPFDPADFALSGAHGDDVWLMETDGSDNLVRFADHVEFGGALNGESFGRWLNGVGELYPMISVTLGDANSGPRLGDVLISEVMYNPGGPELDDLEFVEVFNSTGSTVDLTDWRLRKGVDYDFDPGVLLPADGRFVVLSFNPVKPENASRVAAFQTAYGIDGSVDLLGGWSGRLDNDGERVQLQQPDAPPMEEPYFTPHVIADEVVYDSLAPWPTSPNGLGASLTRLGSGWGNDPASWAAAAPTPGSGDSIVCLPGDADCDGDVDLDDFVALKTHFGATGATRSQGDFDGDGDVDLDDFVILKTNFGTTAQ